MTLGERFEQEWVKDPNTSSIRSRAISSLILGFIG
ncbi:uncharacterized protein FPRO_08380 [Fusarium proliferatum ET1]|uniref:Uncharacterized protein n=1 Tax=Fusarium proliferatum (strain ET1) TaxID=1227346 RepID=A0A1L7W3R4_FUSPR|nr:uncharacterized protein FPRO_08380 [Fusarium proliferatum ET1]CZR47006.1 uncharacterized protein FPRO_08380 [Fusarium proliferatum ET1]